MITNEFSSPLNSTKTLIGIFDKSQTARDEVYIDVSLTSLTTIFLL